jgi:hypothetical protein
MRQSLTRVHLTKQGTADKRGKSPEPPPSPPPSIDNEFFMIKNFNFYFYVNCAGQRKIKQSVERPRCVRVFYRGKQVFF